MKVGLQTLKSQQRKFIKSQYSISSHLLLPRFCQDVLDGSLVVLQLVPLHLVQPQVEQRLCAQGHHNQPEISFAFALDKIYLCLSPQVCVLLGILRGGELHDVFDEVEGLVVHVVGVDLVAH